MNIALHSSKYKPFSTAPLSAHKHKSHWNKLTLYEQNFPLIIFNELFQNEIRGKFFEKIKIVSKGAIMK